MQLELEELRERHRELLLAGEKYRGEVGVLVSGLQRELGEKDALIKELREQGPSPVAPPGICPTECEAGFDDVLGFASVPAAPAPVTTDASTQAEMGTDRSGLLAKVLSLVEERKADSKTIADLQKKIDSRSSGSREVQEKYASLLKAVQQQRESLDAKYQTQVTTLEEATTKKLETQRGKLVRLESELSLAKLKLSQSDTSLRQTEARLQESQRLSLAADDTPRTDLQMLATEEYVEKAPITPPTIPEAPPADQGKMNELEERNRKLDERRRTLEDQHKRDVHQLNTVIEESTRQQNALKNKATDLEGALATSQADLVAALEKVSSLKDDLQEAKQTVVQKANSVAALEKANSDKAKTASSMRSETEELGASVQALRLRVRSAETDLVAKNTVLGHTRHAAYKVLLGVTVHTTYSNYFRKLALYTGTLKYSRVHERYQECRYAVADLTNRVTAAESLHATKDTQVRALAAELKSIYQEKEDAQSGLDAEKELCARHKKAYGIASRALKKKVASSLQHAASLHTVCMAYRLWRAWSRGNITRRYTTRQCSQQAVVIKHTENERAARCALTMEYVGVWHDIYDRRELLMKALDKSDAALLKGRLLEERGKAEAARVQLIQGHEGDLRTAQRYSMRLKERLVAAYAAALQNTARNNCLRKMATYAVLEKARRGKEREKSIARKALERASEELNKNDILAQGEILKNRAALLLKVIVNSEVALSARYWKKLADNVLEGRNRRLATEVISAKAGATLRVLGIQEKVSDALLTGSNHLLLRKYYGMLGGYCERAAAVREVKCFKDKALREVTRIRDRALCAVQRRSEVVVLARWYRKWCGRPVEVQRDVLRPVVAERLDVRGYQEMVMGGKADLRRAGVMLRWLSASRAGALKGKLNVVQQLAVAKGRVEEQRGELTKTRQVAREAEKMQSEIDEATQERAAAQEANDDLQSLATAKEQEVERILKRFRFTQAQCVELGNSLAILERVLSEKQAQPPADQWADVMLFVQGARGWWKGLAMQMEPGSPHSHISDMSL